jgi:hypothetical protein
MVLSDTYEATIPSGDRLKDHFPSLSSLFATQPSRARFSALAHSLSTGRASLVPHHTFMLVWSAAPCLVTGYWVLGNCSRLGEGQYFPGHNFSFDIPLPQSKGPQSPVPFTAFISIFRPIDKIDSYLTCSEWAELML